jgi:hypothetical protein
MFHVLSAALCFLIAMTGAACADPITLGMITVGATFASAAATGAGTLLSYNASKKESKAQKVAAFQQYQSDVASAEAQRAALAEAATADEKISQANAITQAATGRAADAELALGEASAQANEFRAKQYERQANEERAVGQNEAFDVRHQKELGMSKLIARAAASGGGVNNATIRKLGEGIEKEGEFRALTRMFTGENAARGFEDTATGERMTATAARSGAAARAAGLRSSADADALRAVAELDKARAQRRLAAAGIGDPAVTLGTNLAKSRATSSAATGTLLSGMGSVFDKFGKARYG